MLIHVDRCHFISVSESKVQGCTNSISGVSRGPRLDNDVFKPLQRSDGLCPEHHLQSIVLVNQAEPAHAVTQAPHLDTLWGKRMGHCTDKTVRGRRRWRRGSRVPDWSRTILSAHVFSPQLGFSIMCELASVTFAREERTGNTKRGNKYQDERFFWWTWELSEIFKVYGVLIDETRFYFLFY